MSVWQLPISLSWSGASGSPGTNSWAYRVPTTVTDVDGVLQSATDDLQAFYVAIQNLYPASVTFSTDGVWTGLGPDQGDSHDVSGWSSTGAGPNSFAPPATAILLDLRSPSGGRRGRGRRFLGPISQGNVQSNGTLLEANRALVQSSAEDLLSPGPLDGAFVIWSRTEGVARDITTVRVSNNFAVLRSRRD